jgi:hypothetical protein
LHSLAQGNLADFHPQFEGKFKGFAAHLAIP